MPDRCLLYYITDRTQFPGDEPARRRALLAKIGEAARAGIDYIQFREKDLSSRDLEQLGREAARIIQELRNENRGLRTRLLINSRTDIAIAVGADGVHLRSDDISASEARSIWTQSGAGAPACKKPFVAVSCHSRGDVDLAQSQGADIAVFAPVFEKITTTREGRASREPALSEVEGSSRARTPSSPSPAGLVLLHEACQGKIPIFALGGVTLDNAASCLQAGAVGIAAIRLFQENKVEDIVRALRAL